MKTEIQIKNYSCMCQKKTYTFFQLTAAGYEILKPITCFLERWKNILHLKKLGNLSPYLYVLPALIGSLIFTVYPVIYVFYLSLFKVDLLSGVWKFVNFQNYINLFQEAGFQEVLRHTFVYMFFTVICSCTIALVLAVMLNRSSRFNNFVQTAIFLPHIIPLVSVSLLWLWLMNKDVGFFNMILGWFNLPGLLWTDSPDTALLSIILVGVWKSLGFNVLLLIAGLQAIPKHILEAAYLDKANRFTLLFRIIIPLLSPTLFFVLTVNIISSFQVFDSIKIMTDGGPSNSTNLLVHWIYQTGFEFYKIGEASAGSVILFSIVTVLTLLNFRFLSSRIHYQ